MPIEKVSNYHIPILWLLLIGNLVAIDENLSKVKNSLRSIPKNLSLNNTLHEKSL